MIQVIKNQVVSLNKPAQPQTLKEAIKKTIAKSKGLGFISAGNYIKGPWDNPSNVIQENPECNAVVIPVSLGIKPIKEYRRNIKSRTIPLIVLKGSREHIAAGADKCVKKITPQVIEDITAFSSRLKDLWASVETDQLTGLYSRKFLETWLAEREHAQLPFSAVIMDLDKFKNVNDTYGHKSGDDVLSAFGGFIRIHTRETDIACRYGGEEVVICLPNTTADEAHVLIDRLREKFSQLSIPIQNQEQIKCTFSAGVAEWHPGCDIIAAADKMLYQAKETGRNKVKTKSNSRILLMGLNRYANELRENGLEVVTDPIEAELIISDTASYKYCPENLPLYILGTGSVSDWAVMRACPQAVICQSMEDIINKITGNTQKPKLTVLPGARAGENSQTIPYHGAVYIACPSRPGMAGETAAALAKSIENTALVCAVPESTAGVALGIPDEKLIVSDWRIPGAEAPVEWTGVMVWPVDPFKFLNISANVHNLIDSIKPRFSLVVVDCGGSLDLCSRVAKDEGVIVLHREGDSSDQVTSRWVKNYAGKNVLVMAPAEIPAITEAENGFIISGQAKIAVDID